MKRFLFVAAVLLFFALPQAKAQGFISSSTTTIEVTEIQPVKKVKVDKGEKHFAELEFGLPVIRTGGGNTCTFGIGANYVVGYKFNNHVFLGGGVGIGYLDMECRYVDNADGMYAKLFANSKIYITKTKVQPFVDLSIGGIYFQQEDNYHSYKDKEFGVVFNPQIGVNFKLKNKGAIFATVGGNIMPNYSPEGYFTLKIGYAF